VAKKPTKIKALDFMMEVISFGKGSRWVLIKLDKIHSNTVEGLKVGMGLFLRKSTEVKQETGTVSSEKFIARRPSVWFFGKSLYGSGRLPMSRITCVSGTTFWF